VIADTVQFLGSRDGGAEGGGGGAPQYVPAGATGQADADFGSSASDDDIPF
jgi:single-stranded DNA-binding protein